MNSKLYLGISASKHLGFVQFLTGGFHPAISINERNNQSNLSLQFFILILRESRIGLKTKPKDRIALNTKVFVSA